jgi:uncharacterized membrane protein YqgA involved in biofilm formation
MALELFDPYAKKIRSFPLLFVFSISVSMACAFDIYKAVISGVIKSSSIYSNTYYAFAHDHTMFIGTMLLKGCVMLGGVLLFAIGVREMARRRRVPTDKLE